MKRYCLPEEMREDLRKLYGKLYRGNDMHTFMHIIKDFSNPTKIICVGDIVTFNMLSAGIVPDISFVDDRTKRNPASKKIIQGTKHPDFRFIRIQNPPGVITQELMKATSEAMMSKTPVQIFIEGEEDLAALPAIVLAPLSSVVIYGMPEEGAVVVRVTQEKKNEIQSLLERMKCKEDENGA